MDEQRNEEQFRHRPLGGAGTGILLRLSAFIWLFLGMQIVRDGASELLIGLLLSIGLH